MKNRKYFVALCLAVTLILTPVLATAQTPTIAELRAQIADLQRQLAILLGQQDTAGAWCHTFNTNLSIGMSGSEVSALQTALTKDGFTVSATGNFDESTASAVSGFQEKYRSEILAPLGLANPTGYFGPATRQKMNQLYGCGNAVVPPVPPLSPVTPSLTVSSPSTNSSWTSTNGPVIQWSSANIPSGNQITVELLTPSNGAVSGFSSFITLNDGSESGRLTNSTVASGWYYFRLRTVVNGQTVYGGSGVFQFSQLSSQPTLRGFRARVMDRATGSGLAEAEVRIVRNGTYVASPTTGSDGYIAAIPLQVGATHTFTFSKAGYRPYSPIIFTIPAGSDTYTYGTIWLDPETTTTPTPTPASISVSSPSTNSSWTSTNGPVIQWSSANIPAGNTITVELLTPTNGAVSGFSSFTTLNDGSESGRLTNSTVASGWYYFRLRTVVNGQTVYGGSGVFQFSQPATAVCGNGIIEGGEQCDGSNFGGLSCSSYNYTSGSLICSASCTLSTSQCSTPTAPVAASITVTAPTASSRWTPTAFTHSVTWTTSSIPSSDYLTMELMTPTNVRVNAFTPVSSVNDGSQAVNISNITPGYYWFRLTATVNGQPVSGGSGVFQVVNN